MFRQGGASKTVPEGRKLAERLLASGQAFAKFVQLVELQGGDVSTIHDPKQLPHARLQVEVTSPRAGFVRAIRCEQVGTACVILGGGREKKEDSIDPAVGIVVHKKVGDKVGADEPLATIHCHSQAQAGRVKKLLEESYDIANAPPAGKNPLVHRVIHKEEH